MPQNSDVLELNFLRRSYHGRGRTAIGRNISSQNATLYLAGRVFYALGVSLVTTPTISLRCVNTFWILLLVKKVRGIATDQGRPDRR